MPVWVSVVVSPFFPPRCQDDAGFFPRLEEWCYVCFKRLKVCQTEIGTLLDVVCSYKELCVASVSMCFLVHCYFRHMEWCRFDLVVKMLIYE